MEQDGADAAGQGGRLRGQRREAESVAAQRSANGHCDSHKDLPRLTRAGGLTGEGGDEARDATFVANLPGDVICQLDFRHEAEI